MELTHTDWMAALPEGLLDFPLSDLALPGSHDAMSYCLDINSPLVRSETHFWRLLDRFFYCFTRPVIFKWATTQDRSIEEQLSMGLRYFDLRIAHKPNDPSSDLYFTHIIYTHLTVLETLRSVARWLDSHSKEVVILACRNFEGMDDGCHESFICCLKKLFGSKLCPREKPVPSLRSLWASGYQVILSYDYHLALRHKELWPAVPYLWANKHTAQEVINFLEWHKDLGRPEEFFVSGLNLTAQRNYITKNPKDTLRLLTIRNWERLKQWVEEQEADSNPRSLNIIAGDFVGPLPLCSVVIALNYKLLRKSSKKC